MGNITPKRWFRENVLFDIDTDDLSWSWPREAKIGELIANPEKALGGDFPNMQRKTECGWVIPADGMMGGRFNKNSFWRRKNGGSIRAVWRDSSGFGLVFTRLDLAETPTGATKMVLSGIDCEKPAVAFIEVKVNSNVVYEGPWYTIGYFAHAMPMRLLVGSNHKISKDRDFKDDGEDYD
jgi:hypothetical protein